MKYIKINEWCRSYNGEIFFDTYSSKEDAIKDCDYGEYIGKVVGLEFEEDDLIGCEERIIESLEETLYYACGEASEQWRMTTDQETELGKRISKVVIDYINEKDLQPNCYSVESVEQVKGGEQE